MPDRREFLKYFGIGSVIAPVAASELHARLIEPPKVELVEPPKVELAPWPFSMPMGEPIDCTLSFRDGRACRFSGFVAEFRMDAGSADVTVHGDGYMRFLPTLAASKTMTLRIAEGPTFSVSNAHAVLDRAKRARRQPAE